MAVKRISKAFKDINLSFTPHPITKDLTVIKNANAITRSVRNIIFTYPGEKPFDPEFGSGISESLFENLDEVTALAIKEEIEYSIVNYEPRVDLVSVVVDPDYDGNQYFVTIVYIIVGLDVPPQQLEFVLLPSR